ncbi:MULTISPECIES: SDR family oxidoreductase [unclassified Arenibacter]|uniref:SDR family oxidoreductase n=1 Tax=unclassified Arenibacter TaxID=2615047 RepID=UPI000E351D23|nr:MULTISPECIES: SDR family oxidoreductase [unclassified Arenibacter]MCM4163415.1 short chain dehydrogenase [Arenibacter sp. A80]RFT57415.1 SDR family oxidoreductase [Arenibacter sp. P308M17]
MKWKGKVAVVSGSSMGIGKAIATALAQKGANVVLNGRHKAQLYDTEKELLLKGYDVKAVVADIGRPGQCKHLVAETIKAFGKIDILINNAGQSSRGTVEKMVVSNIKALIETNYSGAAYLSKYAVPHLKNSKGHIVFINSVGGLRGMPYNSAYTASKMAQAALAEALRIELYDYGIHVGLVYVGFTENDPKKIILDEDGTRIYLPKRDNIRLAKPQTVAESVLAMVEKRTDRIILTNLGLLANFMIRYFPSLSNWILLHHRKKIKEQFTEIGGKKVVEKMEMEKLTL